MGLCMRISQWSGQKRYEVGIYFASTLAFLLSVSDSAAKEILFKWKAGHIAPLLRNFPQLPVSFRVGAEVLAMTRKSYDLLSLLQHYDLTLCPFIQVVP